MKHPLICPNCIFKHLTSHKFKNNSSTNFPKPPVIRNSTEAVLVISICILLEVPRWLSGISSQTTVSLGCQHYGCELETSMWQVCSYPILISALTSIYKKRCKIYISIVLQLFIYGNLHSAADIY